MASAAAGRHDPAMRRKAQRRGRERGCWVYISGEALEGMRMADAWPIFYTQWGVAGRPRIGFNLYREP